MIESPIQNLPAIEAVQQIVETVQQAQSGEAPFALILGSGFSFGLVPTASELVTESLPLWTKALREQQTFEQQLELPAEERPKIAAAFWEAFLKNNAARGLELALDSKGLPENYAAAYQATFNPKFWGAVGTPSQARNFQRALMRLDQPRLNAAHFLLCLASNQAKNAKVRFSKRALLFLVLF